MNRWGSRPRPPKPESLGRRKREVSKLSYIVIVTACGLSGLWAGHAYAETHVQVVSAHVDNSPANAIDLEGAINEIEAQSVPMAASQGSLFTMSPGFGPGLIETAWFSLAGLIAGLAVGGVAGVIPAELIAESLIRRRKSGQ